MTQTNGRPSTLMIVMAFATVYLVWGSTYFFIQKAVHDFPPLLMGALRFFASGLLLLGWSFARRERVFNKKEIGHAIVGGILMLFIGNGAVIWVEQYMPSAMVAILVSSSPLWFVLLDKPKWKENLTSRPTIIGLVIGFAGVVLLFGEKLAGAFSGNGNSLHIGGMLLLVIGSMAWAGGSLYAKYNSNGGSATVNTSWQMLAAGIAFLPGSFIRGEVQGFDWASVSTEAWLSMGYLIVFGSIIGYSAYVWLLRVCTATQVSTYAYVNPVVAVLLGILFANENITWIQITGLAIILVSVLIINMAKARKEVGKEPVQKVPVVKQVKVLETAVTE